MLESFPFSKAIRGFCIKPFLIGLLIFVTTAPIYFVLAGFVVISYFLHFNYYQSDLRLKIKYGISFGLGFFFANYYWMSFSMLVDFTSYWFYFFPSLIIIPGYFVLFYLLPQIYILDYLHKRYRLSKLKFYLVAIILWFLFEVIRSSILVLIDFQGFSWGLLGYNFFVNDNLSQIYSLIGTYGASLVIAFIYGSLFLVTNEKFSLGTKRSFICFLISNIVIIGLIYSYGEWRIKSQDKSEVKKFSYLIVHPSISEHHGFISERAKANIDKEINIASKQGGRYDFVIFPEGGVSFPVESLDDSEVFNYILGRLDNARFLVAGATRIANGSEYYNSFFVYDEFGKLQDFYDKKYLVPFGEYIPYLRIFNSPLASNSSGYLSGETKSIKIHDNLPIIKPLICYDALYSMATIRKPADVIINISNDIWFIQKMFNIQISTAPFQHLDIVRSRAIESATPVLRSTNLGISAVIDSRGRVVKQAKPYEAGVLSGDLIISQAQKTIYQKIMLKLFGVG
ncbi:MAG: apolipoprotein N-acyltransferase [Rickettsiales bacterium]|nr:apolipoprotein N-acyltransferase [Rickettsiales bacterium]